MTPEHRTKIRDGINRALRERGPWNRLTLEEKQRRMRERNARAVKLGRPKLRSRCEPAVLERARKRLLAFVLIKEHGWSYARVAAQVGKSVESVERWAKAGYPLA